MNASKLRPKLITGIILALFFGVALGIRAGLPYDVIFAGDWIKFTGVDAYYHMRLVDNLVHNFPHLFSFDPYFIYPDGGGGIGSIYFFDWLLASIIWVIGLGSPTQQTIDMVSVYFPAVLGALTVIPVYFIGKELFGRWAGVLSAGLIAILPGEFLGRSILGFTDHHIAETLFTTVTMLFLILAIKAASQRQLTFSHLKRRDWATSIRPIIYSLLAGIFLGIYIFTFLGALLFILIIFVYFVIQFIIDHLKGKSTDYLCLVGVTFFFVTLIFSLLISPGRLYLASLIIALLILPILSGISRLMANKKIKPAYYPLTLVGLGLAGLAIFHIITPSLLNSMINAFSIFIPTVTSVTTIEAQPFLFPGGNFSLAVAWGNFNTGFFLSFISLFIILIYFVIKQGNAEKSLLLVWSLVILVATLGQRRFAYYFAVNVALLTGYLSVLIYYILRFIIDYLRGARTNYMSWQVLELPSFEELIAHPMRISARVERKRAERVERKRAKRLEREKAKMGKRREAGSRPTVIHTTIAVWVMFVIFLLAFFPNHRVVSEAEQAGMSFGEAWWNSTLVGSAIDTASRARFAPSDAWVSSLSWMKENTPEPFGNPDLYYQLEESHDYRSLGWLKRNVPNPSGDPDFYSQLAERHKYPESAYGVVAWWDYGYWITRIAHRIPVANPSQATEPITSVASFFTSQDEKSANEIIEKLDSPYIIIDYETTTSKFWAIAIWAGRQQTEFFEVFLEPQENRLVPRVLIYPEYYRSLSIRLYNFDGKAVTPEVSTVISYEEKVTQEGEPIKLITDLQTFPSYEEAEAYLLSQESDNYKIVGTNPMVSPVPLEALKHYKLIHSSDSSVILPDVGTVPAVKIFEFID